MKQRVTHQKTHLKQNHMKNIEGRRLGMSNYLISHYKGKYRVRCEYDKETKQFPRKLNGTFEDIDCYIDCYNNIRIFYFGKSVLEAYIPSLTRGHNIIKSVTEELGDGVIFHESENSSEVIFHFKAGDMGRLEKYLKPKTSGANISPFSSKNLPKNKGYNIPDMDLVPYKRILEKIGQNRMIELTHITNSYLKSLTTKKLTWEDIKCDMARKGLSGKKYIHSIGKWKEYIGCLEKMCGQ